jgi:uncharacterized protein (TIGR03000 family)
MTRRATLALAVAATVALLIADRGRGQQSEPKESAVLVVQLPADAQLTIEGKPTRQTGEVRRFISLPLVPGYRYVYTLQVTTADGNSLQHKVVVQPGKEVTVDLRETLAQANPKPKVEPIPVEPREANKEKPPEEEPPKLTVPYVPTPQAVVDKMLELAKVSKDDVVYDLGCGDGRIVVTAAKKYGAKGVGVDLNPVRLQESMENVKKNGVEKLVTIKKGDVLKTDVSGATVVTLYLLPSVNLQLKPILQKTLKPGARVVSHDFDMGDDWPPEQTLDVTDENGLDHKVYLWTIKDPNDREPDVIFVPTAQGVVDRMLEIAKVTKDDIVYDLGCGDGRIVVTAAKKYGCKAFGFDINPERIKDSTENVKKNKVEDLVTIKKQDIFTLDLRDASVITLYLLPELNLKLVPQLEKMKPGTRIVSHDFDMRGYKPDKVETIRAANDQGVERDHTIYLWTIPLQKEKEE